MNEIIESLYNRKSVRVYEEKAIPNEMKNVILEAAMQAPTAGCQQLYTILDITDQNLKEALAESCDHQPFIAKAPMVLVFCADCKKWYDAYLEAGCKPRKPDACGNRYSRCGTECSGSSRKLWHWFLLYWRHYGELRRAEKTLTIARICISGSYDSIWLAYKATNET